LDEAELERVGKLAGPEALEALKEQMAAMEVDEEGGPEGEWEDLDEGNESGESDAENDGNDEDMDADQPAKPSDPNDLSAFKMDEYDEETPTAGGESRERVVRYCS
jgi:periodic tryptophan protein 1